MSKRGGIMPDRISRRSAVLAAGALATAALGRAVRATAAADEAQAAPGADPSGKEPAVYGQGLLVQLQVQDLDRSVRFYADVLGFRITERRDDLQFVHVDCGVENLQLGLSAGAAQPPAPGSMLLNFSVEGDIEAVRARLEARGVRFSGPTQVIPGKVRLAAFADPDGYRLRLAGRP
jgi:catechol 2,3-dioxygenase-like lactoylglutathione lyase family enzyme